MIATGSERARRATEIESKPTVVPKADDIEWVTPSRTETPARPASAPQAVIVSAVITRGRIPAYRAALEFARDYAVSREAFGQAIIEIARHLADLHQRALHVAERVGDLRGGTHLVFGFELVTPLARCGREARAVHGVRRARPRADRGDPDGPRRQRRPDADEGARRQLGRVIVLRQHLDERLGFANAWRKARIR